MLQPAERPTDRLRFGRYEPLFEIARGGMARVYAARARGEGGFARAVAVKHMLAELDDPTFAELFLDEARVAALVHSPFVVQTFDVGRATDGRPFLVMELVVGVSLGRLLHDLGASGLELPLGVAVRVIGDAARGLHHAHETTDAVGMPLGIVHRDVSPQNVLCDEHGRVRIADFGIARALESRSFTIPGQTRGKVTYMSPEQSLGRTVDRRSDVFSLGVVAWEAIAGRPLFARDAARDAPIPDLCSIRPEVPAALSAVIARALCREPGGRQRTAEELALGIEGSGVGAASEAELGARVARWCGDALERLRHPEKHETEARSRSHEPARARSLPSPALERHTSPLVSERAKKRRRGRYFVIAALVSTALLGGAGLVAAVSQDEQEPPRAKQAVTLAAEPPHASAAEGSARETEDDAEPPPLPAPASAGEETAPGPRAHRSPAERRTPEPSPEPEHHSLPFGLADFPSTAGMAP